MQEEEDLYDISDNRTRSNSDGDKTKQDGGRGSDADLDMGEKGGGGEGIRGRASGWGGQDVAVAEVDVLKEQIKHISMLHAVEMREAHKMVLQGVCVCVCVFVCLCLCLSVCVVVSV